MKAFLQRSIIILTILLFITAWPLAADQNHLPPHARTPESLTDPIPRMGTQKLLVVLADFPDEVGLFTGLDWADFIATGSPSLKKYMYENSYHQLNYQGAIIGMDNGSPVINSANIDYVRLPQNIGYYANNFYGNDTTAFPQNSGGMVRDALQILDNASFDFAPYANASNEVENLIVIYGGESSREEDNSNAAIQPTASKISWMGLAGGYISSAGYSFDNFTICPDRTSAAQAVLGVCIHEHGHGFGLPDLYDLSFATTGVGHAGIMGYGTYTPGPFHMNAFSKMFTGWLTFGVPMPSPVDPPYTAVDLLPIEFNSDVIKMGVSGNPDEYFLIENRQPLGYDLNLEQSSAGLCRGIFIWHIDMDIVNNYIGRVNTTMPLNSVNPEPIPSHQGVYLVEADGNYDMISGSTNLGECDDTWLPGMTFNANSTPNSNLWDGSASGVSLDIISQNADGSVTILIGRTSLNHRSNLISISVPTAITSGEQAVSISGLRGVKMLVMTMALVGVTLFIFRRVYFK